MIDARVSVLILVLASLLLWPSPGHAQLDRISYKIDSFEINGNHALSDKEIRNIMYRTKGGRFRTGRYLQRYLDFDISDLIRVYRAMGYLKAEIVEREEDRDVIKRTARIRLEIDEGTQIILRRLEFEGLPDEKDTTVVSRLILVKGAPYNPDLIGSEQYRIYNFLSDNGYPGASVEAESTVVGDSASLFYKIEPGPRAKIGEVRIVGNESTQAEFVLRELTFSEGDWYNRRAILESRDRIYLSGFYLSVAIVPGEIGLDRTVPIRIEVKERSLRWFSFGGGFGTEDLVRLSGDWNNNNTFGSGRRASLGFVLSELLADRPFEQHYEISLIEPWMFGTRTVGEWRIEHDRQNIENFTILKGEREGDVIERYRLIQARTSVSLSRELSRLSKGSVAYSFELNDASDPSEPVDDELLKPDATGAVTITWEREGRDHLLDASQGSRAYSSLEYAGTALGGDNHYLQSVVEYSTYHRPVGSTVLALRIRVGALRSLAAGGDLPDYKRFRPGGANSVRGYREETIGPGNYLLLSSAEFRFPLFWLLSGAFFIDGGNAWENPGDISWDAFTFARDKEEVRLTDYRYGVGGGLRLWTPVGPFRVDYGRKLKPILEETGNFESNDVWHFSIGQAF